MEIKYNRYNIKLGFALGGLMLALNLASALFGENYQYFSLIMGIVWTGLSFYKTYNSYVVAKDGYIKKDFGAKIMLSDITETKRFAGDYIFLSANRKIVIDKNQIDKTSINDLESLINDIRDGKFSTGQITT